MLIEIWERLWGYDRWIETEATIKSSTLEMPEAGKDKSERRNFNNTYLTWQATCEATWTDRSGTLHKGKFVAGERSPLFQLYDGQTVSLRYNPRNPDELYIRGMLRTEPPSLFWRRWRLSCYVARLTFWAAYALWFGYRAYVDLVAQHR